MKLKVVILLTVAMHLSILLNAQDKILDSSIKGSKTNTELKVIDKTNDKINNGIDKAFSGDWFKKKNKNKEKSPSSNDNASSFIPGPGKSLITISGTDYSSLSSFAETLKSNTEVKDVGKAFADGIGTLQVSHTGTSDLILDDLLKKVGGRLEVIEVSGSKIQLKMK